MDPNATLAELRALTHEVQVIDPSVDRHAEIACRMADLFEAMDAWLKRGGCLPTDWQCERDINNATAQPVCGNTLFGYMHSSTPSKSQMREDDRLESIDSKLRQFSDVQDWLKG
jgi:hypothetical protein